jgi:hypothetical protein
MDTIIKIMNKEPFFGEDGKEYVKITKEISHPRKTFVKGTISGKYRGDKIEIEELNNSDFFDFEIYDAEVQCNTLEDFRKNEPFLFPSDFEIDASDIGSISEFPKDKLPLTLPVTIKANEKSFGINLLEPHIYDFKSVRKYHQREGDTVYGTFNAYVSGYIHDYVIEIVEEIIEVKKDRGIIIDPPPGPIKIKCISSGIETGKTETQGDYCRKEYFCKNHDDTVWGNWIYKEKQGSGCMGCLSQLFSIIAIIIGVFFLIYLFPFLLIFVGYYLLLLLIGFFPRIFAWIFRILGILFLISFIGVLFRTCSNTDSTYIPNPTVVDSPRETNPPIYDPEPNDNTIPEKDSLITRFRSWKDYSGNKYEGKYQIRLSDYRNAHSFKNSLSSGQNTIRDYDNIVHSLKENDKTKINSLYRLFDSISKAKKLNQLKFAEMIVTFVQDMPYAIVLDNGCDASLYTDRFTRSYLLKNPNQCDGYERFGINTPVEFLVSLKGDCDSRTLLLYTIFSHYDYDVALLSSEFYGHSILGINLPISGTAFNYKNQRYVMWETTAPNCKPGVIPNEISNTNNWRISLKSK